MESELKKEYDDMGIEATAEAIAKSIDLCISYHIEDAAEFVEQWIAFSVSNLNGAEPTIDYLLEFERKVLQAKRDKELAAASIKKKAKYSNAGMVSLAQLNAASAAAAAASAMTMDSNPLAMYGVGDNDVIDDFKTEIGSGAGSANEDDVCRTPKAKGALPRTPARHNDALFSPASFSPIGTPRTHMAAAGSGKIVYTFGNPSLISSAQWNAQQQPKINIKQLLQHNGETLNSQKGKYMFDCLMEKAELASDGLFNIGQSLCRKVFGAEAQDYELSQVDVHSQGIVKAIGRICCEHDGPLDASSTLLIDSDEMRLRTVRLNFSKTKSVGVFPGQVVMVSGMNPKGDVFMVDEIISERNLEPPQPPKFADQLSFVIAAGPYTHDDDLVYDPLQDLLGYLKDHKPNVLILIGPFMEADHKLISETTTLAETFESFFEKMLAGIVNIVGTSTTILVLTSHRDANADPVYPTMPLQLQQSYPNVQILPDPSLIDLNGIIIGMTSTDIVDHIHSNELAVNAGDKVKRIVNYLLNQGSFYPLQPPVEDRMCYDSNLASKFANLERIPNILLLPSEQKCFIRVVNGCLAINPGRLAASSGGTFARFIITPPEPKNETSLFNYVGCQIRKV